MSLVLPGVTHNSGSDKILDTFASGGLLSAMPHAATLPHGNDQIIDVAMARSLHADACRNHAAVAWAVFRDLPAYPDQYAARLATSGAAASPYLLLADSLPGIRAMLPSGLVRSERMPVDPPEVVEIWFAG